MESAEKSTSTIDEQIEFAWHNFEDQQAIIRAADLKAGYLVPFLLFFGASTIPLGTEVVPKMRWETSAVALGAPGVILTYRLAAGSICVVPDSDFAGVDSAHRTSSPIAEGRRGSAVLRTRAAAWRRRRVLRGS